MVELQHSVRYFLAIVRIYCVGVMFLVPDSDACVNELANTFERANSRKYQNSNDVLFRLQVVVAGSPRRHRPQKSFGELLREKKKRRGVGFASGRSASRW